MRLIYVCDRVDEAVGTTKDALVRLRKQPDSGAAISVLTGAEV